MTNKTNSLRKAVEASTASKESRRPKEDERVARESRDQYRRFVDAINRASDSEIERALSR